MLLFELEVLAQDFVNVLDARYVVVYFITFFFRVENIVRYGAFYNFHASGRICLFRIFLLDGIKRKSRIDRLSLGALLNGGVSNAHVSNSSLLLLLALVHHEVIVCLFGDTLFGRLAEVIQTRVHFLQLFG